MHIRQMLSPLRGCHVGFLDDVYVKPECRGFGVVDALFQALEEVANEKNGRWCVGSLLMIITVLDRCMISWLRKHRG